MDKFFDNAVAAYRNIKIMASCGFGADFLSAYGNHYIEMMEADTLPELGRLYPVDSAHGMAWDDANADRMAAA